MRRAVANRAEAQGTGREIAPGRPLLWPSPEPGTRTAGPGRFASSTRGFTLVEVLTAVALTGLVLGLLMYPLISSVGYFRSATARSDAQTVARNALDIIARELSEAPYVQQDMNDNSMIAVTPPLRVDPNDPNSSIVTPPRPDWHHMVRYWRALHDPTQNYTAISRLGNPNPFFLARTVVEDPARTDDEWNNWNDRAGGWLAFMNDSSRPGYDPQANWAAISRIVNTDVDRLPGARDAQGNLPVGARDRTLQPGYPYLYAKWQYTDTGLQARFYQDHVQRITPDSTNYDVTSLSFEPMTVSGEWLTLAQGRLASDKSVYLARYPLWRLGVPFKSWTGLQGLADPYLTPVVKAQTEWAPYAPRDPFLLIYHWVNGQYVLAAVGVFDSRSRTMKVLDARLDSDTGRTTLLYDTYNYPARPEAASVAFDVDWTSGAVRFDFPPLNTVTKWTEDRPQRASPIPDTLGPSGTSMFPVGPFWKDRTSAAAALDHFLLPDTVWVKLVNGSGQPDRALRRVSRPPRDFSDEYQLGLNPTSDGVTEPFYGFVRLPAHFASGMPSRGQGTLWVYYRWRDNGYVSAGLPLTEEHPYLVCAYYRTGAILDISLTIARTDPSARAGNRISQSAHMTRRVKLRTAMREIRDAK